MNKFDFTYLKSGKNAAAAMAPDLSNNKILMGYWHNWPAGQGDGYQGGHSAAMNLTDIPKEYNVVAAAFMRGKGIPTFKPYNLTDEEFRHQVGVLHNEGRTVLISLGGADAHIELYLNQEQALEKEIIRLVETYGFDGLDIDLEQAAIDFADNKIVVPTVLKRVKAFYAAKGKHFVISMAPEFPYLRTTGKYVPYITALEGYYDFIAPQYYNQGGDGVWIDGLGWIAQNDDTKTEDFIYYLTESLVSGTRDFIQIPADKLVIGLPSNMDAAGSGYVINSEAVINAFKRLDTIGKSLKGLMTWSVNWDNGKNRQGVSYNWEFHNRYVALIYNEGDDSNTAKPSAPVTLSSCSQTKTTVSLIWQASASTYPIIHYNIYRDGNCVCHATTTCSLTFVDAGLMANTQYSYFVTATDNKGSESLPSNILTVKTSDAKQPEYPVWTINHYYTVNDKGSYQGKNYTCIQAHTSNVAWTPVAAFTLWSKLV